MIINQAGVSLENTYSHEFNVEFRRLRRDHQKEVLDLLKKGKTPTQVVQKLGDKETLKKLKLEA